MIAAISCCPCTALLVPETGTGAAVDTASLRAACDRAVEAMLAVGLDVVIVLGPAELSQPLRNFVPGLALPAFAELPLPQALAWYLLDRAGWTSRRRYVAVEPSGGTTHPDSDPERRVGLLVMGDGSARRGEKAPGYLDVRAEPFDDAVATALGAADTRALAELDDVLAGELLVAGAGPWKALGALAGTVAWDAELLYSAVPFGVAYLVASWTRSKAP
jgi:hypothetical protein